jgi:hypothetical protein
VIKRTPESRDFCVEMAPTNKTPWKSGKKALKAKGVGIDFKVR